MTLAELFEVIQSRQQSAPPGSYTAKLFAAGEDEIVKKVGEEAIEVVLAVKGQGDSRVVEELADLYYHSLVLLAARGLIRTGSAQSISPERIFSNTKYPVIILVKLAGGSGSSARWASNTSPLSNSITTWALA